MQAYNKLWAALLVPLILTGLKALGVTPDMAVNDAVEYLVAAALTAFAVWRIPNR